MSPLQGDVFSFLRVRRSSLLMASVMVLSVLIVLLVHGAPLFAADDLADPAVPLKSQPHTSGPQKEKALSGLSSLKEERGAGALPKVGGNDVPVASLRQALKAYQAKRFKEAISGFEAAAETNSFLARFLLAHIYRTGKGSTVDHRRAYDYYRQITAEFADADIQNIRHAPFVAHAFVQLARYMEAGVKELDIQADPNVARILFEKAAHLGDVEGQYQLGRFLIESGRGRNVKLGQRWLTRAAMKNNAKAQAYLGALYWQGDVVPRKQALALAWIEFARRNSTGEVKSRVERLFEAVRFDMSKSQTTKARVYIKRLRTKYRVLWRDVPVRPEEEEREFLDRIFLAAPLASYEGDVVGQEPSDQPLDHPRSEQNADVYAPPSFGFQYFNYGDVQGR